MRKVIFTIAILYAMIPLAGKCQISPGDRYCIGRNAEWDNCYEEALAEYLGIVTDYPRNRICSSVYGKIGGIYHKMGRPREEICAYRLAFTSFREMPVDIQDVRNELHTIANELSTAYEQQGNYDSSIYFLGLADTVFRGPSGCSIAAQLKYSGMTRRYANLHMKAGRFLMAEQTLLSRSLWMWSNADADEEHLLARWLNQYENKDSLKAQIDRGIDHFYYDTVRLYKNWVYFIYPTVNFLGCKIHFYEPQLDLQALNILVAQEFPPEPARAELTAKMKKSFLYEMIYGL